MACNSTYTWYFWAKNSLNQDQCVVANKLLNQCPGSPSIQSLVPILNNSSTLSYQGPSTNSQNGCSCSYVIYNLLSACSDCQVGNIAPGAWPSYGNWSSQCSSPNLQSSYPLAVPNDTAIPFWATMTSADSGDSRWSYGLSYALARGRVVAVNDTTLQSPTGPSASTSPAQQSASPCTSPRRLATISGVSGAAGILVGALALAFAMYLFNRYHGRRSLQPTLYSNHKSPPPLSTVAVSTRPQHQATSPSHQTEAVVQPFLLPSLSPNESAASRKAAQAHQSSSQPPINTSIPDNSDHTSTTNNTALPPTELHADSLHTSN